jgi:hypothetical protein
MKNLDRARTSQTKAYQVLLILLLASVSLSNAMKDLNQLQEMANSFQAFAWGWFGHDLTAANAKGLSLAESFCVKDLGQAVRAADEFHWNGRIGSGKAIEIKGINGDISAEPAAGGDTEVIALKKARRSDPSAVKIQVVEHADGVTICALYPTEDPDNPNSCEPGGDRGHRNSSTINVRNNDVRVDFIVRVPAGVAFFGRTVNGEISATSLSSNVISHTVNGSIKISTSGYAQARTVNGEIAARLGDANWSGSIELKTLNGDIKLDLPANASAQVQADTLNGEITSEFPLTLLGSISRKRLRGTIGSGGRELILKTLNGSIYLRRAG